NRLSRSIGGVDGRCEAGQFAGSMTNSVCPYSTRSPVSAPICTTRPAHSELMVVNSFMTCPVVACRAVVALERGRAVIAGPGPAALGRRRDVAGSGVSAHDQFDIAGFDNHLVAGTAVDDFQDLGDVLVTQAHGFPSSLELSSCSIVAARLLAADRSSGTCASPCCNDIRANGAETASAAIGFLFGP